jgi:hypothetical protein
MKNGDRVTGSVVKKDAATLTVKTVHFGVITMPWNQVESIATDAPLTVVLPGDQAVQGTLATTGQTVRVEAPDGPRTVPLTEITALRNADEQRAYERLLNPSWTELWTITGSLGLAGTAGNARTSTFTVPVAMSRVTNSDRTTAYFNLVRASAVINNVSAQTAQAVRGGWGYSRNITPRLFWNFFNDYEYDRFQNLDLRIVAGTGLGYSVWKSARGRLDLVGGAAWNRESFDPIRPRQPFTRNSAEAYWGDDLAFKLNDRASLTQSYRMFNNLTNTGEYRQNFDFGLNTRLTSWLTWNASFSDRFLSNPVAGRKRNDLIYSTGLGFTLSR